MKRAALHFLLLFSASALAETPWQPEWRSIALPDTDAQTYYAEHHTHLSTEKKLVWVFLVHPAPKSQKYVEAKPFKSELQEWVLTCSETNAGIATIRYMDTEDPTSIQSQRSFLLIHPNGREQPTRSQVEAICSAIT